MRPHASLKYKGLSSVETIARPLEAALFHPPHTTIVVGGRKLDVSLSLSLSRRRQRKQRKLNDEGVLELLARLICLSVCCYYSTNYTIAVVNVNVIISCSEREIIYINMTRCTQ
jgi:hypothetical protein